MFEYRIKMSSKGETMNNPVGRVCWVVCVLFVLAGCSLGGGGGSFGGGMMRMQLDPEQMRWSAIERDRQAILGMAGTYKVTFDFEETLALQAGYELQKPYHTEAEELVVVVEDRPEFISLQHLLVLRHEGEVHVIKHWRQDWVYESNTAVRYRGDDTWDVGGVTDEARDRAWVQTVYNADDSPRYTTMARWRHDGHGLSTWDGYRAARPVPLRDTPISDKYTLLISEHSLAVSDSGWLHMQRNKKWNTKAGEGGMLCFELGRNRYTRIPDEGFGKAHEYWKNTAPYWREVRKVWAGVIRDADTITLRERWKGDPMFSHLFGLADEYWGQDKVSGARPRIREVVQAFLVTE